MPPPPPPAATAAAASERGDAVAARSWSTGYSLRAHGICLIYIYLLLALQSPFHPCLLPPCPLIPTTSMPTHPALTQIFKGSFGKSRPRKARSDNPYMQPQQPAEIPIPYPPGWQPGLAGGAAAGVAGALA